jgi:hypothetical protein
MAVNRSRSRYEGLIDGTTDGKYQKPRPNTRIEPRNAVGDELTIRNRRALNTFNGFMGAEATDKVNPGAGYRGSSL